MTRIFAWRCVWELQFSARSSREIEIRTLNHCKRRIVSIRGDWRGDGIQVPVLCEFNGMMWKCVCEGFAYHRARNRALRCTIRRFELTESSEHSFHGICALWFLHCLETLFLVHSMVVVYAIRRHGIN